MLKASASSKPSGVASMGYGPPNRPAVGQDSGMSPTVGPDLVRADNAGALRGRRQRPVWWSLPVRAGGTCYRSYPERTTSRSARNRLRHCWPACFAPPSWARRGSLSERARAASDAVSGRKLSEALSALERQRMIELRWLARATLSALDDAISARPTSTSYPGSATAPTTSAPRAHPGAGARARRPNEVTGEDSARCCKTSAACA